MGYTLHLQTFKKGVQLIDQHEIKESYSISALGKEVFEKSRYGEVSKMPEEGHTEMKIITHIEDFEALEQEWRELVWESDTHIFQTFEWNRIWWRHFGVNKKLHIVAVYTGKKLAGIAPLFEDDVTLFGHELYSCLRFLGSYVNQPKGEPLKGCIPYSDYLDCIIHPGYEQIFYQLILEHFNDIKSAFDEIILDEVPEESAMCNTMIPLMAKSNCGLRYRTEQASSSPVILLDSTWEEYLNSMSSKSRYNARRYFKRSKEGKKKVFNIQKVKHAGELPRVLSDFIRMHQQQWNNRGFAGTFSEKKMHDFFMEIAKSFYEKDWLQFNMAVPVEEDAKYVAIDVLMTYKDRVYLMHRGMDEDPLYRKQGPGNVLLYASLNEAINDGVKVFDMLRGTEEFKLRVATKTNQNKKIIASSDNKMGKLLPGLVKKYLRLMRDLRIEKSHITLLLNGKPFFKGLSDYIQFLYWRIKQKIDM